MDLKQKHESFKTSLGARLQEYECVRNEMRGVTTYDSPAGVIYMNIHDPQTLIGTEYFLLEIFAEKRTDEGKKQVADLVAIVNEELSRQKLAGHQTTLPNDFYHYYNVFEEELPDQ